jgi:hypothetical protein
MAGVTRPGILPVQDIVDYVASMFTAARTSGRHTIDKGVSQDLALRLGSILWIMLQVCFTAARTSGRQRQRLASQD